MVRAELLADFYGAAIDRSRLTAALDSVRLRTNAMSATFHLFERTPERLRHRWQSSCSNTPQAANQMALLDELNPRTVAHCNPEMSGPSVLEDHYLPDSFQPEVRRWQEQLRSFGMGQFLAARITLDGRHEVGVALHGRIEGGPLDPESRDFLIDLMPHVREAVGHVLRMQELRQGQGHLLGALDHLRHAILTCDGAGRITSINSSAVRLLGKASETCQSSRFRPGATLPRSLMARVVSGERVLRWQGGAQELQVCAMPLGMAQAGDALLLSLDCAKAPVGTTGSPGWVLALADPEDPPAVHAEDLARSFGISHAEALLLRHLALGGDLGEFAALRDVSIHTARSQLKALMAKTGASRQAELVRMALGTPGACMSDQT
ncbi:helix-turn-helix transcriptional regulator [Novosphingobium taihuense]|uniref:DNA-binding CsgD family transcriptional regulator/PAS domain-containing protein n=1 Tax=Novosphingobium taihuense TaxID=260085 RepID=A0A7W7EU86_9SPHN|nr:helix-turn-helix transcriptional regulator [Novosphingobium taihuense]MBB4614027.1 DNA-binding CsgD family transcriptional regulator/PAS domain-containing protein [Novosphingobium taihuense]TWH86877.1 DNA-binding CsgD family transcriptional regulator [Novosphingobium taihuense]